MYIQAADNGKDKHGSNVLDTQAFLHQLDDHLDLATLTSLPRIWNRDRSILFGGCVGDIVRCIIVGHGRIDNIVENQRNSRMGRVGEEERERA